MKYPPGGGGDNILYTPVKKMYVVWGPGNDPHKVKNVAKIATVKLPERSLIFMYIQFHKTLPTSS